MASEVGVGYVRLVPTARGFGSAATRALRDPLTDTSRRVGDDAGRVMSQSMTDSLVSAGSTMTAAISVPLGGIGLTAIKMSGDFEASMNGVRAVTGAAGSDFEKLRNKAKELGSTTAFSASEAANAMEFLGMAGWDTEQILTGIPDVLNLAAASSMELADAANIASNIMSGFGIEASEMGRVSDVLAKAASSANVDVGMLGETMQYTGPLAAAAGWSLEEAAAATGLLGDAGIQGSNAGTGLNSILATLADTSSTGGRKLAEFGVAALDANGEVRPLTGVLADLADKGAGVADVLDIFGLEAGPKLQALLGRGSEGLQQLITDLENSEGAAEEMAAIRMEGFNGSVKELQSAFEGLMIAIGESGLLEFATDLVSRLTGWTQSLSETNPALLKLATVVGAVVAAVGPMLIIVGKLMSVTMSSIRAIGDFGRSIVTAAKAFGRGAAAAGRFLARMAAVAVRFTVMAARIAAQAAVMAARAAMAFLRMSAAAGRFLVRMAVVAARFTAMAVRMAVQMAVAAARVVAGWVLMGIQSMVQAARMAAAWIVAMGPVAWIAAAIIALVALVIANWDTIRDATVAAWEWVWEKVLWVGEAISGFFSGWDLPGKIAAIWGTIRTVAGEKWNGIVGWIAGVPGRIWGALASLGGLLYSLARSAFQRFRTAAGERASAMLAWVTGMPGRISRAIGSLKDLLYEKGKDVVRGLWDGIRAMGSWLRETLTGWAKNLVPGPIAKALGISSPSRVMRDEIGRWVPAGLADGISAQQHLVDRAAADMLRPLDDVDTETTLALATTRTVLPDAAARTARTGQAAEPPQLVLRADGGRASRVLVQLLQDAIRTDLGGDVQRLGRTATVRG